MSCAAHQLGNYRHMSYAPMLFLRKRQTLKCSRVDQDDKLLSFPSKILQFYFPSGLMFSKRLMKKMSIKYSSTSNLKETLEFFIWRFLGSLVQPGKLDTQQKSTKRTPHQQRKVNRTNEICIYGFRELTLKSSSLKHTTPKEKQRRNYHNHVLS